MVCHCSYHPTPSLFENYYLKQAGNGLPSFSGTRYQRGHGLGNIFRSLAKIASPLIAKGVNKVGKELLHTGTKVVEDVIQGKQLKSSLKNRSIEGLQNLVRSGSKRKRNSEVNTKLVPPGTRDKKKRPAQKTFIRRKSKQRKTSDIFD